ncbi:MAG TPA: TonB-dependent receptor, partial [Bacteroidetes bacterium]|nr:TonB-dependent receptor [Bacteroidota bacterium]
KGAASSLYGSGALSGVINIITKNPNSHPDFQFRQNAGIFDRPSVPRWKWTDRTLYFHRTDFGYSDRFGPLGVRFDLAHQFSTGDREMGRFNRWFLTGKSKLVLPDRSNLTLFFSYSYDDRDLFLRWLRQNNALNVPPSDRGNRFKLRGALGYVVYRQLFSSTLSAKVRLAYNRQLPGVPFHLTSSFRPALGLSGQVQINWQPHPDHRISLGFDYSRDQVAAKYYGKRYANGVSPYIQEIWKVSRRWQLNMGARYDTYSLVGDSVETQLSPRIGFSFQPLPATILHFSFGKGFRAASVVERYLSVESGGDVRVIANPQLPPERSTLWDTGIRQTLGRSVFAELTAFVSEYDNLIELTLSPQSLSVQYLSYPRARISGLEAALRWKFRPEHFTLNANATWMKPVFVGSGEPLPYRPRFIGLVTPQFFFGHFNAAVDFRYVSPIEKVMVYPKDERVPVKIWNLRIGYKWRNLEFKFMVRNAGNYNYTVSERVLGEIRNFSVGIDGKF